MVFEWDPSKAAANFRRHRVRFTEATTVFDDPLALTYPDPDHSQHESRFITFGYSASARVLVVAHSEADEDRTRIISARRATRSESHDYQEER